MHETINVFVDEEEEEQFEHVALPSGKIGAKKMRKLQEKEERARQREVCRIIFKDLFPTNIPDFLI